MSKIDHYAATAAELFGVPPDSVSPTMRSYAKLRSHVRNYTPESSSKLIDELASSIQALSPQERERRLTQLNLDYAEMEKRILAHLSAEELEKHMNEEKP